VSGPRQEAERAGRRAETLAAWWLRLKFYRILARDLRTPVGEVDLIARRGRVLAFVEVKRRATLAEALNAISPRQRQRIARAGEAFLARHPKLTGLDIRFDVVAILPGAWPYHLPGAWTQDPP